MAKPKGAKAASKTNGGLNKLARLVPGDPPILVGGGGSTLVWIKSTVFGAELTPAQIAQMVLDHQHMPHPDHPAQYRVFSCNFNAVAATVKADSGVPSVRHNDMDTDRHQTIFHLV